MYKTPDSWRLNGDSFREMNCGPMIGSPEVLVMLVLKVIIFIFICELFWQPREVCCLEVSVGLGKNLYTQINFYPEITFRKNAKSILKLEQANTQH